MSTARILQFRRRGVEPRRWRRPPVRLSRAALIVRVLERELRERAGCFQPVVDFDAASNAVPRPHRFAVETSDLDVMALARAVDAALEG